MSKILAMFNGKLGSVGQGPNFVSHALCEKVQAATGDDVPDELVVLAQEVEVLYDNWCSVVEQYDDAARSLKHRATATMRRISEEG